MTREVVVKVVDTDHHVPSHCLGALITLAHAERTTDRRTTRAPQVGSGRIPDEEDDGRLGLIRKPLAAPLRRRHTICRTCERQREG